MLLWYWQCSYIVFYENPESNQIFTKFHADSLNGCSLNLAAILSKISSFRIFSENFSFNEIATRSVAGDAKSSDFSTLQNIPGGIPGSCAFSHATTHNYILAFQGRISILYKDLKVSRLRLDESKTKPEELTHSSSTY